MIKLIDLINEVLSEEKKKRDRCLRIADRKYNKPSAYKSGAVSSAGMPALTNLAK